MKKIYRRTQMKDVIGRTVHGTEMHIYNLPYRNAAGHIFPEDLDLVDMMLAVVEKHPELHIVTYLENGHVVNYYETKDAWVYYLCAGNPDPEIEFNKEYRREDSTPGERAGWKKFIEAGRDKPYTPEQIMAINFAIQENSKLKKA